MQTSEDKTTLMAWISTRDQTPLTKPQALTGAANIFVEICAMMDVDPYQALDVFLQTAQDDKAEDFEEN